MTDERQLLDQHLIRQQLQTLVPDAAYVDVFTSVTSTNTVCAEKIAHADFSGLYICLAEHQTQGRGRRGRVWSSPASAGLYLSIAQRIDSIDTLGGLSLAVGLVVLQTLETHLGLTDIRLKWPNDLLYQGKKLGGVLIEIVRDASQLPTLIIGIGINCSHDDSINTINNTDTINNSDNTVACLADIPANKLLERSALAASIIVAVLRLLEDYAQKTFAFYQADWNHRDAFNGQSVVLMTEGRVTASGIERGVNASGHLLLETEGRIESIDSGELSLRLAPNAP